MAVEGIRISRGNRHQSSRFKYYVIKIIIYYVSYVVKIYCKISLKMSSSNYEDFCLSSRRTTISSRNLESERRLEEFEVLC